MFLGCFGRRLLISVLTAVGALMCHSAPASYRNPIIPSHSPDPWVLYTNGYYYLTRTTGGDIRVYRAPSLTGLANATYTSAFIPNSQIVSDLWAPELHYLDGKWYIYSTGNTAPGGFAMRMFVLEGTSQDPQGTYTYKGLLDANLAAIDETVLVRDSDGARFLVWSQFDSAGQSLYVAPLLTPASLGNPKIRIATPTYSWERNGNVNEGPQILKRNGKTYIIYSGSGTWTEYYCLGALINTDGNYTNAVSWTKFSNPVFQRYAANATYCVGHGSFTKSPSGAEDWLVYHGTSDPAGDQTPKRTTRIQRYWWYTDGTPNFDVPLGSVLYSLAPDEAPTAPPRGLRAEFYPNTALSGTPVLGTNQTLDFNWGAGAPIFSMPENNFSARWTGMLYAPTSGVYTFQTVSDDGTRLRLNQQQLLINDWVPHPLQTNSASINLSRGEFYDLRLEYFENAGDAVITLAWIPPGGSLSVIPATHLFPFSSGLRAEFFSDTNFIISSRVRLDPQVDFNWAGTAPDLGVTKDRFSARWTGRIRPPTTGDYLFHTVSSGAVRVYIGNKAVMENSVAHTNAEDTGTIHLSAGQDVELRLEYTTAQPGSMLNLSWTPPGGAKAIVPAGVLAPAYLPRNQPPALAALNPQTVLAGRTLTVTNSASDADVPGQTLTFSLEAAPTGASIDASTGLVTWRPAVSQSGVTNQFTVKVTDSGLPPMSATQPLQVSVLRPVAPVTTALSPEFGVTVLEVTGDQGPDYLVEATTNLVSTSWMPVHTLYSPELPFYWTNNVLTNLPQAYFRVLLLP